MWPPHVANALAELIALQQHERLWLLLLQFVPLASYDHHLESDHDL